MEKRLPTAGQSPTELKRQLELERAGQAFVIHRDPSGKQHLTQPQGERRTTIGRGVDSDLPLSSDVGVSRLHAELDKSGGEWLLIDDGLSSNGSFVNGERVSGRKRLRDGDVLCLGSTVMVFRNPADRGGELATEMSADLPTRRQLTATQLAVLDALCAPMRHDSVASPATNREIADGLHVSIEAVKAHMRKLFEKFGVGEMAQTRKRIRLAELALISGAVSPRAAGD